MNEETKPKEDSTTNPTKPKEDSTTDSTNAKPPIVRRAKRTKKGDLVISSSFEFENRWAFTEEIVDYGTVERLSESRLQANNSNLKRVKLCGLPAKYLICFLLNLSESENRSQLEHLEIDRLDVPQGSKFSDDLVFDDLKVLWINSIKVYACKEEANDVQSVVLTFKVPSLSTVYLGGYLKEIRKGLKRDSKVIRK